MLIVICRSNPIAPDPRVEKEAVSLVEAGHQVRVIGWDRSASLPVHVRKDHYEIHRIPIRSHYGTGLSNLPQLIRWQIRLFLWLFTHRKEYDALHACDFDTVLPCMAMKLVFGKKLVYDIFDFYPDHLRRTPGLIKSVLRAFDYWIINQVDAVILVDDSRRAQIKSTSPKRLFLIYNSPADVSRQFQDYEPSPKGGLRLAYIGLFQKERGLLEVAALMKQHPEWTLDMAGFGGDEEAVLTACRDTANINLHGIVPYEKALHLSAKADVLFATYDPGIPNHKYSSPNKVFEAMMLSKPIVVARGTNMDKMITNWECGIVVSYGNIAELEEAFLQLANDPALRERLGQNGRKAYDTFYKWDIMKLRLQELYAQVFSHG